MTSVTSASFYLDTPRRNAPIGVTLTGSGRTTVATAPLFAPGSTVTLDGAEEATAIADTEGRITFTVDLGAPHEFDQYSPGAALAAATSGYRVTRSVTFA